MLADILPKRWSMRRRHIARSGYCSGISLRDAKVRAEGDLDFRGTLGVSKDVPVGFKQIRLNVELDTDASKEQIATLLRLPSVTASFTRR